MRSTIKSEQLTKEKTVKELLASNSSETYNLQGLMASKQNLGPIKAGHPHLGLEALINLKCVGKDLSNANFRGSNLTKVEFIDCNLKGADFSGTMTNLAEAQFINSDVEQTNFKGTKIRASQLVHAKGVEKALFDNPIILEEIAELRNKQSARNNILDRISQYLKTTAAYAFGDEKPKVEIVRQQVLLNDKEKANENAVVPQIEVKHDLQQQGKMSFVERFKLQKSQAVSTHLEKVQAQKNKESKLEI
jgi:hypothetical protein